MTLVATNEKYFVDLNGVAVSHIKGREKVQVMSELNCTLAEGDFISIMGPSGSGKSTLLELLGGLRTPDKGSITVAGSALHNLSQNQRAKWRADNIGFIFQFYHLLPVLTAYQNVELPLLLKKYSTKERKARIDAALALVEMQNRSKHLPNELSGGEQQRVAIARAIVANPPILLCDEPTGDLNQSAGQRIVDILENLNREFSKTIVMVTHDPNVASRAQQRYELCNGKLVRQSA